jgi:hypothetical protein
MERRQAEAFRDLQRGAFIGLGPAIARRPLRIGVGPVETADRGAAPRLMPLPEAPEPADLQDLLFARAEEPAPAPRARTPRAESAQTILERIDRSAPAPFVAAPPPELSEEAREEAIDAIVAQMAADGGAAFQPAAALHRDFLVRCRIRRLGPRMPDVAVFSERLTIERARLAYPHAPDAAAWKRAIDVARRLPRDLFGVYLLIARAALADTPCPTDDEIARFFGSHSPGRARRALAQLEQIEAIVTRSDAPNRRVIALPDLDRETANPVVAAET